MEIDEDEDVEEINEKYKEKTSTSTIMSKAKKADIQIKKEEKVDYKKVIEEKKIELNELINSINYEISKIVICTVCNRKFANNTHYLRHVTLSEIHRKNECNL